MGHNSGVTSISRYYDVVNCSRVIDHVIFPGIVSDYRCVWGIYCVQLLPANGHIVYPVNA